MVFEGVKQKGMCLELKSGNFSDCLNHQHYVCEQTHVVSIIMTLQVPDYL